MITSPAPSVAAAIATHRRDKELQRLLEALQQSNPGLRGGIFVADNASSPETAAICSATPGTRWIPRPINNGPGPAWNTAIAKALEDPHVTHLLVLDDDVVPPPDAAGLLLDALAASGSAAAAPLLFDEHQHLWAFPEPREIPLRAAVRRVRTAEEARTAFGAEPHSFCWATGACMLYSRAAFERCGFFREDFWMLGEDLEFSMRVAAALGGAFTARGNVLSYLAFHSAHSAHLKSYLAGNFKRYARTEGLAPGTLWDAWCAFYQGAIGKQPAGTPAGARLRERATRHAARK